MRPKPGSLTEYSAVIAERKSLLSNDLTRILPAAAEFVWEVGSGHGHFLTAYAQAHPTELCIGIDIIADRVDRAERKRERARLDRLHFIHAEASLFLDSLPAEARIRTIFVLFPDPWPKKRHHKHRLLQKDFLNVLAERVISGARLHFRTDHQPYFEETQRLFQDHPQWAAIEAPWPFELETVFQKRATSFHSIILERRS
jgi:tRNA (guanine-N7-)-methyltransferase